MDQEQQYPIEAIDMARVIGIWYTELDENMHCISLLFLDDRQRIVMATCVCENKGNLSETPWHRSPLSIYDQQRAVHSMQFAQRRTLKMAGREKAWELLRGGRTADEFVEALADMPGIKILDERVST